MISYYRCGEPTQFSHHLHGTLLVTSGDPIGMILVWNQKV